VRPPSGIVAPATADDGVSVKGAPTLPTRSRLSSAPPAALEYGSPGAFARVLARRRSRRMLFWLLWSMTAFALAAHTALSGAAPDDPRTVTALLASGVGLGLTRRYAAGSARAVRGAQGEAAVAAVLRQKAAVVVHGAMLGAGGDADHVLLGPALAVVETKSAIGVVQADERRLSVAGRLVPGNPVAQARRQAAAVSAATGRWCEAVVCVTGMRNGPLRVGSTTVCSLADLSTVLAGCSPTLTSSEARQWGEQLSASPSDRARAQR